MSESGGILKAGVVAARLEAAIEAERSGQSFGAIGAALKKALAEARPALLQQYSRGDVIADKLSDLMDEAIGTLWSAALGSLPLKSKVAIAATGGYGRRQLAPLSDIDLLILHAGVSNDALATALDAILHPLWDAGLVVGHGVHTPASAASLASKEMTALTAYFDARLLCGDEKLFKDFAGRVELIRWTAKSKFVRAKRVEQEARHEKSNQSRYLSEPDLKEGKGGLRDIHVIGWIYRALYGKTLADAPKRGAVFRPDDAQSLMKAERFLLSLRVHLHDLRGRADERLTFDIQPALAERLGYADRPGMSAAERMMKHYFVTAMEIGRLTRIFWARIEEDNAKLLDRTPLPLPKALTTDEAGPKANLRLKNGRLDFANAAAAAKSPVDLFRYFRAFAKRPEIDFHPDALDLISKRAMSVTSDVRKDPVIAKLFVASIAAAKDPVKLLRVMSETGLLGKYVPSFASITGRIEYGLYRRFSLDEHVFQAVGVLTQIRTGALADQHPIATDILQRSERRGNFYIAVLLHQSGWSLKGQSVGEAEALIGRVSLRLGADSEEAALIAWCAARSLLMARVAERRNLAEARAISAFALEVGSIDKLDLLLVLTVCHLRAVGANAWNGWARRQITSLYYGAKAWIEGGDDTLLDWLNGRDEQSRDEADAALAEWPKAERAALLRRLSGTSLAMIDPNTFTRVADLARGAEACGVACSIRDDAIEAIVYADDRAGLLADLAGAIAGSGGNVRNVHALTLDDGKIIDVFAVNAPDGVEGDSVADYVKALHGALLAAARSRPAAPPALRRRIGDRRALFDVPAAVRLDADASDEALVVEAEGGDRPGLLYSLASALTDVGVAIKSAHIATYGERAVDTFYLQTPSGEKIRERRLLHSIEQRLYTVLAGGERAKKIAV